MAAVDGLRDCLPDADILEGILLRRLAVFVGHKGRLIPVTVDVQIDHPVGDRLGHGELWIFLQFVDICGGYKIDKIHVSRQQEPPPWPMNWISA